LRRLGDTVSLLFRWSEDISLNSRIAEIAAIRDSIDENLAGLASRAGQFVHRARLARARSMIALAGQQEVIDKAYEAFTAGGGTRAHFQRWWPQVLDEVI
jgi:hypothetical protein